jgi:beta-galactosidase
MELLTPTTANVLAYYGHPYWGKYAAVTQNAFGSGLATYVGCLTSPAVMAKIIKQAVKKAGLWGADQQISYPLITKWGVNQNGRAVHYYFNYSGKPQTFCYPHPDGRELLTQRELPLDTTLELDPWGVAIVEENEPISE